MLFRSLEWGAYLDGLTLGEHDMFILGWVISTVDPDGIFSGIIHTEGGSNYSFFDDIISDALINLGRTMPDGERREKLYKILQARMLELKPMLFLYNEENFFGLNKNVEGFVPSPKGYHDLTKVTFKE